MLWPAPFRGDKKVSARVVIPGSKSVTNRALILAAQAQSPSLLKRPLISRDTELMVAGLRAMGVGIKDVNIDGDLAWEITPAPLRGPAKVDVGNAGTVMRFLPPLSALAQGDISFDGDPRSYERPLGPVISALEDLGIEIEHDGRYSLPMVVKSKGQIPGGALTIDASASSQFLSALLLIAPRTRDGIVATHKGGPLPSMPHIDMTVQMLRDFGAEVVVDKAANSWSVSAGALQGQDLVIEPDLSNAAPFLSIAMVCGGSITIADWPEVTTQPGDQLREILSAMGATITRGKDGLTITGGESIRGIDIDLHDVGELTPAIAALAALADSPSHLRGIGHLRLHETDRLAALTREINSLGGSVVEDETSLHITPHGAMGKGLHGGTFHTYEDHRLATAGAVIGLVIPGVEIENVATTRKTLPDFPGLWQSLVS
ncbi:MAG: 3-phosphoshikimate 1-carboxyvinyltransferase [Actinobacteria bacterium]|uniref:3-phosphoshikimate 1-carboxyvinyltransferase n=1 Tax=freshwater metagenome TaxID=449393 RepID=A0A6J7U702_9ZZZZ|nr:3-phosphoshikimate 1-carboxyvinyltransferase [Actinomycetota bacterium]MSY00596.1 3-phosphoshikimate 1-carboxyvinyltransferase [Actinomycetota bacterium]MTA49468.1 3-phosphoshikimate 1-carboxyvinyltransferase [Actinomycetota bacterium]MTA91469.1 3-phosphoshikimate 1-carboxyvinyltransferase [Actinomycetota bacterium]